jgi:signal transduction histidine kinase
MRVPLTRIQWSLENISTDVLEEQDRESILSIRDSFRDLTELVNQLLDTTEADKVSVHSEYLFNKERLELVVWSVKANYKSGIQLKDLKFHVEVEKDLPKVKIDRDRINDAISVFVENAILYTPKGGRIEIRVFKGKRRNEVVFSIRDNGIGIDKKKLSDIFTKFFRTKEAMAIDMDRAGLGLSFAKEIIERHGGKVGVESVGNNQGSYFWFSLPAL